MQYLLLLRNLFFITYLVKIGLNKQQKRSAYRTPYIILFIHRLLYGSFSQLKIREFPHNIYQFFTLILAFEKLGLFLRLEQIYLAEDDRDANHISVDYSCAYGALYRYVEDRRAGFDAPRCALYGYGLWRKGVNGRYIANALHSGHHCRCILQAHSRLEGGRKTTADGHTRILCRHICR